MKIVDIIYRYEARDTSASLRPSHTDAALRRLEDGNKTFAALFESTADRNIVQCIVPVDSRELGLLSSTGEGPKQHPFAVILGCSDARVPIELIFNEGPNDLFFVIRVAGNSLGTEVLGSLKYAIDYLSQSLKLIVVLGHSGCGALTTAVDVFLNPSDYLPLVSKHSLRSILDRLLIVVDACARKLSVTFGADVVRRPGYRRALIEASIVTNAALASYSIRRELGDNNLTGLKVVYGVYLLDTREVWSPFRERGYSGLATAPDSDAAFSQLGDEIARSKRIASLVEANE